MGNKIFKMLTAGAVFSVLLSASLPALADWKTYAATECQTNATHAVYDAFGGICNTSTTADLAVLCPVVRDLAESGFPDTIRHSGRSGNSAENVVCVLRNMRTAAVTSNSGSGMAGYYHYLTAIPRHSTSWQYVWNVFSHLSNISTYNYGSYVMTCTLPNSNSYISNSPVRSCLFNYSVEEN